MSKLRLFMFVLVGLLGGCSTKSIAGEYYLIEKSRHIDKERSDICEKLVKNFNMFREEPPMVCERKFHSNFKDFRLPNWEKVDPKKYIDVLERLLVYENKRPWPKGIPGLKDDIYKGKVNLWKAKIDINFDGKDNVVYKMKKDTCNIESDYGRDGMPSYRFMVERNDKKQEYLPFDSINGWFYGGVFYYKDRPYFHTWNQWPLFLSDRSRSVEGPSSRIAIYETSSPRKTYYESFGVRERCEIGYRK